jgi:hypothetical protein
MSIYQLQLMLAVFIGCLLFYIVYKLYWIMHVEGLSGPFKRIVITNGVMYGSPSAFRKVCKGSYDDEYIDRFAIEVIVNDRTVIFASDHCAHETYTELIDAVGRIKGASTFSDLHKGFITSSGRFVCQHEAFHIAIRCNQIDKLLTYHDRLQPNDIANHN